jgi:hypothetical protein
MSITASRGAIYTRWGRPDCPSNGTTLVYTGMKDCIVLKNFLERHLYIR